MIVRRVLAPASAIVGRCLVSLGGLMLCAAACAQGTIAQAPDVADTGSALPSESSAPPASARVSELWDLLAAQEQAQGTFEQSLFSETGELTEQSRGRYAVLRPGYFLWEIEAPDRQRLVVANDVLWHYDIDLATATRRDRKTGADEQFTALELLGGDRAFLQARFSVEPLGGQRFRLVPRFPQAGFASVDMVWDNAALVAMDIRDRSGQLIQLKLAPDPQAAGLSPGDFVFEPPAGVDVYDAAGY